MKYVLDSNVFKKISSQKRNKNIDKWLASIDDADLFITALTVQETQEGIERLRKNIGCCGGSLQPQVSIKRALPVFSTVDIPDFQS